MRLRILFLGLVFPLLALPAMAQNDPGQPDTVRICDNTLYFAKTKTDSTSSTAFLRVLFENDSLVQAMTVPFHYVLGFTSFDSVSYAGSRVESLSFKTVNFDTLTDKVLLGAVPVEEPKIAPGKGLFATLWFTLNSTLASVSLDTTFFPPTNHLLFANPSGQLYTPTWAGPTNFSTIVYLAGDGDHNNKIELADVIFIANFVLKSGSPVPPVLAGADADGNCKIELPDVIYLVNYLLKHGPAPKAGCVFPACN